MIDNEGLARREEQGEKTKLFNESRMSVDTREMIKGLYSLPISCTARPASHQNTMSDMYGTYLQALADYSSFHSQNRHDEHARKLVWDCGKNICGGLGDRVRGLTYTLMMAVMTQRVLLLRWRDSRLSNETYLKPNIIDWRLNSRETERLLNSTIHIGEMGTNETNNSVTYLRVMTMGNPGLLSKSSNNVLKTYYRGVGGGHRWIAINTNMFPFSLVRGQMATSADWLKRGVAKLGLVKLGNHEVINLMGITFRYLFSFSDELTQIVADARSALGLSNLAYVGVHVRTSFAGSKQHDFHIHKKKPKIWNRILDCGYKTSTSLETPGQSVIMFLATDSYTYKKTAHLKHGSKIRALNNSLTHMDLTKPTKVAGFKREGIKSMWAELVLLAESHSIVMPASGFSFLAGSICLIPQPRVLNGLKCDTPERHA